MHSESGPRRSGALYEVAMGVEELLHNCFILLFTRLFHSCSQFPGMDVHA